VGVYAVPSGLISHSSKFPMFSPGGKKLVWASKRNAKAPHETNIFIADWRP